MIPPLGQLRATVPAQQETPAAPATPAAASAPSASPASASPASASPAKDKTSPPPVPAPSPHLRNLRQQVGLACIVRLPDGNRAIGVIIGVANADGKCIITCRTAAGEQAFDESAVTIRYPLRPKINLYDRPYESIVIEVETILSRRGGVFPNADRANMKGIAHGTGNPGVGYNCIAHSLGDHTHWINPPASIAEADKLYAARGYVPLSDHAPTERDLALQNDIDRVVIFATDKGVITHGMIQQRGGAWTSKDGANTLVRVESPHTLAGGLYGKPVRVYVRIHTHPNPGD